MADNRPRRFFGLLCAHKWKVVGKGSRSDGLNHSQIYIQQCEHCGAMKEWP